MHREDDPYGPVKLDDEDVSVVPIEPTGCDHCDDPATHYVMLDMRGHGTKSAVAECCEGCARDIAASLAASLRR